MEFIELGIAPDCAIGSPWHALGLAASSLRPSSVPHSDHGAATLRRPWPADEMGRAERSGWSRRVGGLPISARGRRVFGDRPSCASEV